MIAKFKEKQHPLPDREWFQALIKRANDGDAQAQEELRETLAKHPQLARIAGDLGRHAMDQLIRTITGNDVVLREAIEAEAQALLDDLAGSNSSKHRLMLATHVVCCWLQVRHFDLVSPPIDDAMSDRFRRWHKEANHRYGQAVKLLHDLTKMEGRRARRGDKSR
ncbi:MAG: hypothetical protein RIC12_00995 [Pirellulales bacterium]